MTDWGFILKNNIHGSFSDRKHAVDILETIEGRGPAVLGHVTRINLLKHSRVLVDDLLDMLEKSVQTKVQEIEEESGKVWPITNEYTFYTLNEDRAQKELDDLIQAWTKKWVEEHTYTIDPIEVIPGAK